MLVKFFRHGSGKTKTGDSVKEYLLNERVELGTAKVIRGNVDDVTDIINSIQHFSKTYTSGCLSFASGERLSENFKQSTMDEFENTLLPGLDKDQYASYWVEHTDKNGRLELNFVIPNVELLRNTAMTIYNHEVDKKIVNLWKDLKNFEFGFDNPSDPLYRRNVVPSNVHDNQKITKADHGLLIGDNIQHGIDKGKVRNRADVVKVIQQMGYTIHEENKKFIKIKNPDTSLYRGKERRPIKLKGAFFEEDFDPVKTNREYKVEQSRLFNLKIANGFDEMAAEYESRLNHRAERLQSRYKRKDSMPGDYLILNSTPKKPDFHIATLPNLNTSYDKSFSQTHPKGATGGFNHTISTLETGNTEHLESVVRGKNPTIRTPPTPKPPFYYSNQLILLKRRKNEDIDVNSEEFKQKLALLEAEIEPADEREQRIIENLGEERYYQLHPNKKFQEPQQPEKPTFSNSFSKPKFN